MIKNIKKVFAGLMAASLLISAVPFTAVNVNAATVTKGEYDFSNMSIRRVWFNTFDPVFLVDNYQRVWLDDNVNVLAYGDYKNTSSAGDLMAPMKEMFAQIGVSYQEDGDDITIVMNGQTMKLTAGSRDVVLDGKTLTGALTDAQVPVKVNVKEKFGDFNTYLSEDYFVTYLPVAYVLNTFQADIYVDSNVQSFYAAVPVFKTEETPSYATAVEGYGATYDGFIEGALNDTYALADSIADNIVALQNEDGGFATLPYDTDMAQENLADRIGSLKDASSLENGSTTAQLRYLARYITEKKPADDKYQNAFFKGLDFILKHQNSNGGWSMTPTEAVGFNSNTEIGNKVTTEVLTLLQDIAVLNNADFLFVKRQMRVTSILSAIEKGNAFLVSTQLEADGVKSGWATQVKSDGTVTMGRTYERESVSAFTTKDVVAYLMRVHAPSEDIQRAVKDAVAWLASVKLADKEMQIVKDTSMNNGFDVYLADGNGTWAANYVYDADAKNYRPLYADVDPSRPDQKLVNQFEKYDYNKDGILYATRTTVAYYDNTLAADLIDTDYKTWLSYLEKGFPEIPAIDKEVQVDVQTGDNAPTVEITNTQEELIDKLLTPDEKKLVEEGLKLTVTVKTEDISGTVSLADKAAIAKLLKDHKLGQYVDITVTKTIGNQSTQVTATDSPIRITLTLPETLKNNDAARSRTYSIVRVHNGEAKLLDTTYDEAAGTLSFESDKFSTFAIVYQDTMLENSDNTPSTEVGGSEPSTGDSIFAFALLAMMAVSGGVLWVTARRKIRL